jgi:poly(hydroxyalkanoate) depolymerase family esterase
MAVLDVDEGQPSRIQEPVAMLGPAAATSHPLVTDVLNRYCASLVPTGTAECAMAKRSGSPSWGRTLQRSFNVLASRSIKAAAQVVKQQARKHALPRERGSWITGVAVGGAGARRYLLYRPADVPFGERLPLLVMLHGCGQDSKGFAQGTRMNRIADRERFMVLYPEQDRLANPQGCWNWFDTRSGRAGGEADLIMRMVDQACMLYLADRSRVAVAGLSAGASMATVLATRHPGRFKAVVMHSGVPPGIAHSTLSAVGAMRGSHRAPASPAPAALAVPWPPLMVIHGVLDSVVSVKNAQAAVDTWAGANGRAMPVRVVQRGTRYSAAITDYKVAGRTLASLVEIDSLGHAWSGGSARHAYTDGKGPDASRMVWTFVARQFTQESRP